MDVNVKQLLGAVGIEVKKEEQGKNGTEYISDCPFCGKKCEKGRNGHVNRPFYVNSETGAFNCWSCRKKGHVSEFIKGGKKRKPERLIDLQIKKTHKASPLPKETASFTARAQKAAEKLFSPEGAEVLAYLKGRGFNEETLKLYGIGASSKNGKQFVCIPTKNEGRDVVCIKYRAIDEKIFLRSEGGLTALFGGDIAAGETGRVFVFEGEMDAMAGAQYGLSPCVSITAGANTWTDDFSIALLPFEEVILCYDNDEPGEEGAKKAADALGAYRCSIMKLPLKDMAECLQAGIPDTEIFEAVRKASLIVGDVVHIGYQIEKTRDQRTMRGYPMCLPRLTALFGGGPRPGDLIVVSGHSGMGKTTFLTYQILKHAQSGIPCYVVSPEMGIMREQAKFIQMLSGVPARDIDDPTFESVTKDIDALPLWAAQIRGKMPLDELIVSVEIAVRRHGVKIIVLDHMDFFMVDPTDLREQDATVGVICNLAKRLMVAIYLVVHCRKTDVDFKTGIPKPPDNQDIKGASAISQLSDAIIIVHRKRDRDRKEVSAGATAIMVTKMRHDEGAEGNVPAYFSKKDLSFNASSLAVVKEDEDDN